MITKLIRHGKSAALVIDSGLMELLDIDMDTPLDISTDGQILIVSPVRYEGRRRQFEEALKEVNRRYSRSLRRLAD